MIVSIVTINHTTKIIFSDLDNFFWLVNEWYLNAQIIHKNKNTATKALNAQILAQLLAIMIVDKAKFIKKNNDAILSLLKMKYTRTHQYIKSNILTSKIVVVHFTKLMMYIISVTTILKHHHQKALSI